MKYILNDLVLIFKVIFTDKKVIVVNYGSFGDLMMVYGVLNVYSEESDSKPIVIFKKFLIAFPNREKFYCNWYHLTFKVVKNLSRRLDKAVLMKYELDKKLSHIHLTRQLADSIGVSNPGNFFIPDVVLDSEVQSHGISTNKKIVCVQSSAKTTHTPNKNWIPGRMKEVVESLKKDFYIVQIGLQGDENVNAHLNLAGKLSFENSLSLLKQTELFIGLEGALMHGAAAMDIKALIIYGGYISPAMTAYPNIYSIFSEIHCSPCLLISNCPFNHDCMQEITVNQVLQLVKKII